MAIPISYNLRSLRQRPVSTLATALGVALVVAILIGALALAAGFERVLVQTGSPDNAMILRVGADGEISSSVTRETAAVLRALPDVAPGPDGRPLLSQDMVVLTNLERRGQTGSSNITVRGVDVAALPLRPQVRIVEGRMFRPGSDEVMVGHRLATRFEHCGIGERVRFNRREFTVVGHFEAGGAAYESEIWGDNAVLMPTLNRDTFQTVTFRLRDPARFAALKKQLEGDRRLGVQVLTERAFYAEQSKLLSTVLRAAGVLITLIMAVGAIFGAMNTMFAAVGARTRETAVLLTLGFSRRAILASFILESVLLSLLGGVLGCLLSLPVNGIATSTTNWTSFSEIAFAFRLTPAAFAAGLAFAVVMGVVGGFLPALRAARQPLAASLRAL